MKYAQLTTIKDRQICLGVSDQQETPDQELGWIPLNDDSGNILWHEYKDGQFTPLSQKEIDSLCAE